MPVNVEEYISKCTAETSQEIIEAINQGVEAQAAGKTTWINAVTGNMDIADQNETAGATRQDISPKALYDHFTRFAQATRKKSARTTANKLYNDFVLQFRFPSRIHDDYGGEFENILFKHLEELCGVQHSRTTPYHPDGNGQAELFNQTLLATLRTLQEEKSNWAGILNKVVHVYN
ncbi:Retrovirus-related Pol poly from transposon 412 [Paramuricea clavata]|uniref:Retrovirus-related Pol poly from transposon 412 n=1 Tax=Paramuricea clavata TaxID=317549 RepID=A0A6S7G319_PARCT|nr:Retrovirus-related Pol poly from transposon 412 [Paramuricea clavata]